MSGAERAQNDLRKVLLEISRLDAQIQTLRVRADKVRAYIEMAQIYEADVTAELPKVRGGVSGAAVRAAVDAIRERGAPIHTRDLIDVLAAQGIQIGGSNPTANLSGFLSRSDELQNSRASGWGLSEWDESSDEQNAAPPDQTPNPAVSSPGKLVRATLPAWDAPGRSDLDDDIPF